jgi:hypothetical protein
MYQIKIHEVKIMQKSKVAKDKYLKATEDKYQTIDLLIPTKVLP